MSFKLFIISVLLTSIFLPQKSKCESEFQKIICQSWEGFGNNFGGSDCAASINLSCKSAFLILPEFIEFFKTWEWGHIILMFDYVKVVIEEYGSQIFKCKYYLSTFGWVSFMIIPAIIITGIKLLMNFQTVIMDFVCVMQTFFSGQFYQCGLCLGKLEKEIYP